MSKLIALMPAYNEAHAIVGVLDRVAPYADAFILVDDCSKDTTVELMEAWRKDRSNVYLIPLSKNVGASGALKVGYIFVKHLLEQGVIAPDDLIMEIDSDGQHDPKYIPQLRQLFRDQVDIVLARRDFSVYPRYKRFGNRMLTLIASILSGSRYHDVESNYRFSRARVFPKLLEYFSGYRYSGAFEVGIILALLKYRINNDFLIEVPFYKEGASATDGFHVLAMGLRAWLKVCLGLKNRGLELQEAELFKGALRRKRPAVPNLE
jgi:glycosyltransferase involved in cell wall biosynthesis